MPSGMNLKTIISHGFARINTDKALRYAELVLHQKELNGIDTTRHSSVSIRVHPWLNCIF
jgi:hypothetical protein